MTKYLDSILMNGFAELGNLSGWNSSGVHLVTDGIKGSCFQLDTNAYMQQDVPTVLFSKPSSEYLFKIDYRRLTDKDPLNLVADTFVTIRWKYESGKEDLLTAPLGVSTTPWASLEVPYTYLDKDTLIHITYMLQTSNALGGIRVDNMQLLPSDNVLVKEEDPGNDNYDRFRELSILYGPEADLPELG